MPLSRENKARMISFERARAIAREAQPRPRAVGLPLLQALGLVAAVDHLSAEPVPPWDNSAMDGYALIAADTAAAAPDAPVELAVRGVLAAGQRPTGRVRPGQALRIMTGAMLPAGADAVVMIEQTDGGTERVLIKSPAEPGQHVRFAGEDLRPGAVAVAAGALLGPADLGSLASAGIDRARVWDRPRVELLVTGDELLDPGKPLRPGKIRNSNAYSLQAQLLEAGAVPLYDGVVRDDPEALAAALERAAGRADFVLSTGGVSMGDFDYVAEALNRAGFETLFTWVAQRPGAPLVLARRGDALFFGLPGNPASVMVCCELHVRPLLRRFMNQPRPDREAVVGRFVEPLRKRPGLMQAARVLAEPPADGRGAWRLTLSGGQGSGLLQPLARANALALTPVEPELVPIDCDVEVWLLR